MSRFDHHRFAGDVQSGTVNPYREAIDHLVEGTVLDVSELPTNRIILHFNAAPSFTGDGMAVFD
jgi:hypothetical protein